MSRRLGRRCDTVLRRRMPSGRGRAASLSARAARVRGSGGRAGAGGLGRQVRRRGYRPREVPGDGRVDGATLTVLTGMTGRLRSAPPATSWRSPTPTATRTSPPGDPGTGPGCSRELRVSGACGWQHRPGGIPRRLPPGEGRCVQAGVGPGRAADQGRAAVARGARRRAGGGKTRAGPRGGRRECGRGRTPSGWPPVTCGPSGSPTRR